MDENQEELEHKAAADVGGLHEEGVDILTDVEASQQGKNTLPQQTPVVSDSVKNEMASYLREFEFGPQKTKPAELKKDSPVFTGESPFVPKPRPIEKPVGEPIPIPDSANKGALSLAGSKVMGGGPVTPIPKQDSPSPTKTTPDVKTKIDAPDIKPLRTFKTDAEEAIKYQNMSVISIRTAETKKVEEVRKDIKQVPIERIEDVGTRTPWATIFVSLLLVVGGGVALYLTYFKNTTYTPEPTTPTQTINTEKTLIRVDETIDYEKTINAFYDFTTAVYNTPQKNNTLFYLRGVTNGIKAPLSAKEFFSTTNIPERISRVLGKEIFLGVHEGSGAKSPVVIFKTDYFENTYAGMLEWERTMTSGLWPLIEITYPTLGKPTTTPSFVWGDKVVFNKDARVLYVGGIPYIFYSILDRDTVLITTTEVATLEVIKRYTETRVTR